jgi:hypothetical protein
MRNLPAVRRGARAADSGGLENRCPGNRTVGSNPTLSAITWLRREITRPARNSPACTDLALLAVVPCTPPCTAGKPRRAGEGLPKLYAKVGNLAAVRVPRRLLKHQVKHADTPPRFLSLPSDVFYKLFDPFRMR